MNRANPRDETVEPRHIIIADDDDSTRRLLTRQLERSGFVVSAFSNGRDALKAVQSGSARLIVADWIMPEMDGLQLCRAIVGLHNLEVIESFYFIVLTSHSDKNQIIEGLEAGANDYLTKPYHPGELLARIRVGDRMLRLQDELIAKQIEVLKANAMMATLAERLEQLANTDTLTGLANRRNLLARLDVIWRITLDLETPLSVIMIDIDRFKKINDSHGHNVGDAVLREVALRMRAAVRGNDVCGRLGGEEFIIVCPGLDAAEATRTAERVRARIAGAPFACATESVQVTASFGVAQRAPVDTEHALIARADESLYVAKRRGRNQVTTAHDGATALAGT